MAVIHKCDACSRAITGDRTVVDVGSYTSRVELCAKCAAPIHAALKKLKRLRTV